MDHRTLFGIAAIILSVAALNHSMDHAYAGPMGPNVSAGNTECVQYSVMPVFATTPMGPSSIAADDVDARLRYQCLLA